MQPFSVDVQNEENFNELVILCPRCLSKTAINGIVAAMYVQSELKNNLCAEEAGKFGFRIILEWKKA